MAKQQLRLDEAALRHATLGGAILGGGGGGSAVSGERHARLATQYRPLYLTDLDDVPGDAVILTASMVGAPAAAEKYIDASAFVRSVELFLQNTGIRVGGIISNENGGESTVNGWVASAVLGIPLLDAQCNGRAHPTGVMGSMNLHKLEGYSTVMTAVGGNPETGRNLECVFTGPIGGTAKMVRLASIEAGGLVAVARNPVTADYIRRNGAVGSVSHAIETGRVYEEGLKAGVEQGVKALTAYLHGEVLAKGVVDSYELRGEGGFDVGHVTVDGCEMTFWNEYMTVEGPDGKRRATFPDLIMTLDAETGRPLPSSDIRKGQTVYVISTGSKNLRLSPTMYDPELIGQVEPIVGKKMAEYLPSALESISAAGAPAKKSGKNHAAARRFGGQPPRT